MSVVHIQLEHELSFLRYERRVYTVFRILLFPIFRILITAHLSLWSGNFNLFLFGSLSLVRKKRELVMKPIKINFI